jgi:MFS family permease
VVTAFTRSNPSLRRLLLAWGQSCLGTGAGYVALLLLAVRHVPSAWGVAAVLLCDFLPAIALAAWFGTLADRYPRRRMIVGANLLQAAAWGALAFARTAPGILALALLAGSGNALLRPALRSALPVVAGESSQLAAALYDTLRWLGTTIGPLIAAGLFAIDGVGLPLALNGASFLIAAVAMATLTVDAPRPAQPAEQGATEPGAKNGLRAGLAVAFSQPGIAAVIVCSAGSVIAGGLLNVSEPFLATKVLHGSASDYALLVACYGIGMVLAAALVAWRGRARVELLFGRYLAAVALTAAGMAGSALVGSVPLAGLTFAATGYANSLLLVSETQLIQARVPNAVQGRLFGAKDTIEGACFLVGLLGAGALIGIAGVRVTLAIGAGICAICAAAAIAALAPRTRDTAAQPRLPQATTGVRAP